MTTKSKRVLLISAALGGSLLLTGCTPPDLKPQPQPTDPALLAIQQAVTNIEKQHAMLASVERGKYPIKPLPARPAVKELQETVYMRNWHGPVSEALTVISGLAGYTFYMDGEVPAIDHMVNIDETLF